MLLENKEKEEKEMNKKFVTLLSVAVLSAVTSGVYADEISLGGNAPTSSDNTGLVVAEKPIESPVEKPAPKVTENLDLGGSVDKAQDKDNTGVVVEPTTPSEKPKEEKPKEDKPSENLGKDSEKEQEKDNIGVVVEPTTPSEKPKEEKPKEDKKPVVEDTPEIKEQKQKAEENVDEPKPLNVTKEEIKEQPIETNTGHTVVSTNQGKVVVETEEGDYQEKEPYEIGAVKQKDGTIVLKDKEGQLKVLPNTGTASTIFATIWGLLGLVATVYGRIKIK